jgi:hypothetical protein
MTLGKLAVVMLCMLAGYVCAYRGEDLERAGIMTKDQGLAIAVVGIILAVGWGILWLTGRRGPK